MSTESKGIYHWKLGDVALARVCQKAYARVRVVKDEKGLFYDDKVLGISGNEDGSITVTKELCYYVETCRTNHRFWLPYTSLHLAERSRPFYGNEKVSNKDKSEVSNKTPDMPRKNSAKEDHVVPLEVKVDNIEDPDHNTKHELQQRKEGRYETAFSEFVRRSKEQIFDKYFESLQSDVKKYKARERKYLVNVKASTEDKFDFVVKTRLTENEIDNHLHQCWKYNFDVETIEEEEWEMDEAEALKEQLESSEDSDVSEPESESPTTEELEEEVTVHTTWCLVCGQVDSLQYCITCPAAFHEGCTREWIRITLHRTNPAKNLPDHKTPKPPIYVEKILSSTRTKYAAQNYTENDEVEVCPSCKWGPQVGYGDIVWNKLGTCGWWPARVLPPGAVPACLLARTHASHDWPIKFYGTKNYSWGGWNRTCLLLPSHTAPLGDDTDLKDALMDASDEYITIYLT